TSLSAGRQWILGKTRRGGSVPGGLKGDGRFLAHWTARRATCIARAVDGTGTAGYGRLGAARDRVGSVRLKGIREVRACGMGSSERALRKVKGNDCLLGGS